MAKYGDTSATGGFLPLPKFHADTAAGVPLVGGKVYTYSNGTTTPKVTYSDAALSVENTNPVILDARGNAIIYLSGTYTIVLKDSTDVTIWTMNAVRVTYS